MILSSRVSLMEPVRESFLHFPVSIAVMAAVFAGWTQPVYCTPARTAQVRFPFSFEQNLGQADTQVRFLSRGLDHVVLLTPTEAVLKFKGRTASAALAMRLLGARPSPQMEGLHPLPARSNYFHGQNPRQWHSGVPHYSQVRYSQVYPGVDLVYHGEPGELEYDFVVLPGGDPREIQVVFEGAQKMIQDSAGGLVFETPAGQIRQRPPVVYQEVDGVRRIVEAGYLRKGSSQVGFQVAGYDHMRPLVIDPVLSFATFLSEATPAGIAVDPAGNVYVLARITSACCLLSSRSRQLSKAGTPSWRSSIPREPRCSMPRTLGGPGTTRAPL